MGLSLILTAPTFAATDLVQQARTEHRTEQTHNVKREADFKKTEQELKAEKAALIAKRNALQAEADKLSAQFSKNENSLARLEEKLRLETGSLGEI
ncbi:flagellar motor protein MotA, partial [Vibrio diabolicus]|nr:flagellar motor protein MotA [Vibrio diabolicus]